MTASAGKPRHKPTATWARTTCTAPTPPMAISAKPSATCCWIDGAPMLAAIIAALSLAVSALAIAAGGGWAIFVRTAGRFQKVDESLHAHTIALTQLATTVAVLTEGQGRLLNNAEELDDAMQAMQISTA